MKEYKKSYIGFILWILGFCIVLSGCAFLPETDIHITVTVLDNIMTVGCFVLSLIVYKTEYVYWYNGTSYEDAKEAGSERRKSFALEHMKRFGFCALGYFIYSIISIIIGIPFGIDIAVAGVGIVVAAVSTLKIKL